MEHHSFTWHSLLPASLQALFPQHIFTALVVMLVLVVLAYRARRSLLRSSGSVIPDEGVTLKNVIDFTVEKLAELSDGIIGKEGRKYVHAFGTFFLFILTANLFGLVPGFSPPTSNFNITFGLGLVAFAAYNYFGFREHGISYTKQFIGPMTGLPSTPKKILRLISVPVLLLSVIFFFVIEGISHLVRPVSLALRLFGNMFGDHQVVEVFIEMTKVVVPVLFYGLGALVSLIQAFVFTLLSVIYVALAISHEH